jgi:NAD-dependent SIR2 family protein deacetylase
MYFLVFGGCNRITPFIVSVQDTKEKILEDMNGRIVERTDYEAKENLELFKENLVWQGTVVDLDFFKKCYSDINDQEACICMPITAFIFYNGEGDAVSVIHFARDILF